MTSPNILLDLQNTGVSYTKPVGLLKKKTFWAFEDVSMTIREGETIGVIGKNGAGKSSLLAMLSGVIAPSRGVLVRNTSNVALLTLQAGFVRYLTGRQNAMLGGILLGLSKKEMESRMQEVISFSDLGDFIDEPIRTYSAGMRARLGFAVAILADPEIILIDEMLGVGDMAFKEKSSNALRERINSNRTAVIVSHQMHTIKKLCTKVIWIENKKTKMFGNTEDVVASYMESQDTNQEL